MSGATTPGFINPQPRTPQDNVLNWQRLAAFLASGAMSIGTNGQLTVNVSAPVSNSGTAITLSLDEISGLIVMNGALTANTHSYTAGETVSGDQIVYVASGEVFKADSATTPAGAVVGMTRQAATAGNPVLVLTSGRVTGLVGLTPGANYFLGSAGAIATTPPASGLLQSVGVALDASTLVLQLGQPFVR